MGSFHQWNVCWCVIYIAIRFARRFLSVAQERSFIFLSLSDVDTQSILFKYLWDRRGHRGRWHPLLDYRRRSMSLIETVDLWKTYVMGAEEIHALRGVSVAIDRGEYVAIMGPSGSGKSTLMNLIGCLDTPSRGTYRLNGKSVDQMNDDELAHIRNEEIGFVFQTFNLLPRATALHNVELPMVYAGMTSSQRERRAKEVLSMVELEDRMTHRPSELSGDSTGTSQLTVDSLG